MAGRKGRDADGDYLTGPAEQIMEKVNRHISADHLAGDSFTGGVSRSTMTKRPKIYTKIPRAGSSTRLPKIY